MKNKIVIVIALLASFAAVYNHYQVQSNDRFIKYHLSSDMYVINRILDDLGEAIFQENEFKNMSNEDLKAIIKSAESKIMMMEMAMANYRLLNKAFYIDISHMTDILYRAETVLLQGENLNSAEQEMLLKLVTFSKKHHDVESIRTYEESDAFYRRMALPEEMDSYLKTLNSIEIVR